MIKSKHFQGEILIITFKIKDYIADIDIIEVEIL